MLELRPVLQLIQIKPVRFIHAYRVVNWGIIAR